jgi:UDPglucose 6-dehydrogenase
VTSLSVVGTGYLGATHAVCMAELGHDVIGVDVDAQKIERLRAGEVPFFEPGLEPLLRKHLEGGRLRFTTDYAEAAAGADVHFLCVGTPQAQDRNAADLQYVDAAVRALIPHLTRRALVVGKSTVPSGTADRLDAWIRSEAPAGEAIELAWNPEFLREGFAVEDTLHPDRLVVGLRPGAHAERQLREVYARLLDDGVPLLVLDFATAELVKVAANAFLATKISFINAMAEVCEAVGGDVTQLSKALSYDARIGGRFLHAGLGFGGGCLPKDIRAFMARAEELGVDQAVTFLRDVDAINLRRRDKMVAMALDLADGSFSGRRVGVLGAAFKPNSDDIRDSPALDVADRIRRQGATVTVYDPAAMANARRSYPDLRYAESAHAAVTDADLVLHLTEWQEFRETDPAALGSAVRQRRIVDGRNALDPGVWRAAGWTYRALGRH